MTTSPPPQDTLVEAVRCLALPRGARLLLAVSGGPDSVALLDTAAKLAPDLGWQLRIGHINHRLRGEESDEDERFVRHLAQQYGLDIDVERIDVAGLAASSHRSIEVAAREARYRALRAWLRAWPGDAIVTGHTLDDQAETVLLRLFRGAGIVGLGGMRPSETVLRPFLHMERASIRQALEARAIGFREDSSNADRRFRRNALRLDVMPSVLALEPSAPSGIARAAGNLQIDADYIRAEAQRAVLSLAVRASPGHASASLAAWRALHPALRRHTLRLLIGEALGSLENVDMRHIEDIEKALSSRSALIDRLPHGLQVTCNDMRFVIEIGASPESPVPLPVALPVPGTATFGNWTATVRAVPAADLKETIERLLAVRGPWHAFLDASRIEGGLTVRGRRAGDRVYPLGLHGSRKIQDIFVDWKVPSHERDRLPLVTYGDDVVWVPGNALDRRYAAQTETKLLLHLCVKPADPAP